MFVRAKNIKNQKYAYLVKNIWKKGHVSQITKKYLGRIFEIPDVNPVFIPFKLDFSSSLKDCMIVLIKNELCSRGFIVHSRQKAIIFNDIIINFSTQKIIRDNKNVVLFLNNRYFYPNSLKQLLNFYQPESSEDVKGQKLAQVFSDAGISIPKEYFIQLYTKIYIKNS